MTSPLNISVGGKLWWEGLTAEFTITNTSNETLEAWSYSFTTPHKVTGVPWGVSTSAESLTNGQTKYTLTGIDWAQSISAGGSVTVGFNAQQGRALGSEGTLTAELLMTTTSKTATTVESSIPIVDSTAVYTLCSTRHSKAIGNLLQRLYRGQRQSDAPYKRNEQ